MVLNILRLFATLQPSIGINTALKTKCCQEGYFKWLPNWVSMGYRMLGTIIAKGMKSGHFPSLVLAVQCHLPAVVTLLSFSMFPGSFPQVHGKLEGTDMAVDVPCHIFTSKSVCLWEPPR